MKTMKQQLQRSAVNQLLIILIILLTYHHPVFAQAKTGFIITHKIIPTPVVIDGKVMVYYEFYLNNNTQKTITLSTINCNDESSLIATYDEHELLERFVNRSRKKQSRPTLAPGDSAIIYFETNCRIKPSVLNHTIVYESSGKGTQEMKGPRVKCSTGDVAVLGAPVGRGNWAAVWEPSWLRGHRRVVFEIDGKQKIPGRFAIDFMLLDNDGNYASGDEDTVSNWLGYAADVLAAADGVVASVNDTFEESKTLSAHPSYPADKATGNYISIDIGNGRFAFYEHLKPGSILVKPGQRVKTGEIIASIGFTGQSTGPHLHFHLADADSPLGAEGLPFVFEHFNLLGSYPDFSKFGKDKWFPVELENNSISNERPAPNTVIRF